MCVAKLREKERRRGPQNHDKPQRVKKREKNSFRTLENDGIPCLLKVNSLSHLDVVVIVILEWVEWSFSLKVGGPILYLSITVLKQNIYLCIVTDVLIASTNNYFLLLYY